MHPPPALAVGVSLDQSIIIDVDVDYLRVSLRYVFYPRDQTMNSYVLFVCLLVGILMSLDTNTNTTFLFAYVGVSK